MTYKWYRKLTKDEFYRQNWYSILIPHGAEKGKLTKFAPELIIGTGFTDWERYEKWWNKHFNTKLARLLDGVDDVY